MAELSPFEYRARDPAGAEQRGVRNGTSAGAVARELTGLGWIPLDINPQRGNAASVAAASGPTSGAPNGLWLALQARWEQFRKPNMAVVQAAFSRTLRELSALLRAGVPLMKALELSAGTGTHEEVRAVLLRLSHELDSGHTLVAAAEREHRISGTFTAYDVAILQVGEQTGRLPEAFLELHRHREFVRSTQDQVSSALRYPAFVVLTCLLALVVVNLWVIPSFAKVFAQARAELPMLTRMLLGLSQAMIKGWPVGLGLGALGVVLTRRHLASAHGRMWWDRVRLRLPIVGPIMEGIVLARLSTSLATSLKAGMTITDALAVTGRTLGNTWFESRLQGMCTELARGASITAAARHMEILPPTMLQLFAIGEKSGSLEELMAEISLHYQAEVDFAIKGLAAAIEPLMVWVLGLGVLVLALGIFMPMWDLGRVAAR